MTASKTFNKHPKHKALYHALIESILADEDVMDKGVADIQKKRKPDDADRDEDPPAKPDQGLKRRKTSKDTEQSKKAKSTRTSKGTTKSQPKSTGKSAQAKETMFKTRDTQVQQDLREDIVDSKPTRKWLSDIAKAEKSSKTFDDLMSTPIDFSAFAMNHLQISDLTQDILVGPAYQLLKGTCRSYIELKYNMEECYKALNDQLDWNNPEGGSTGRTYMTSLTKTKASKYDLQGIEDMVPNLWSPVKVAYNTHAFLGTSNWRSKRQTFYGYASNRVSKHDVYSTKRILAVTNVKVNVWYGYGHLKKIEVRRSDQQLYKFMEGDFQRLRLNDIKDMLILVVQNRLFNLKSEDIVHLATALRMLNNLEMGYISVMARRRWSNLDKKRSRIMVKDIDRQLLERRLMRSLEKFVGGREYGKDLRLLQDNMTLS
ncbi:hypothetical protein Tco_0927291 [Tanacetum coccineum]